MKVPQAVLFSNIPDGLIIKVRKSMIDLFMSTGVLVLCAVLFLWVISIVIRDVSIIDMAFSGLIALVILYSAWVARADGQAATLTQALVVIWGVRMSVYLIHRNWGHGEDVRYTKLRSWVPEGWAFNWLSLRQVFLLQGVVIWMLTLPQQIFFALGPKLSMDTLAWVGVALWMIGFVFESVGDWQLSRFRADESKRGTILNTGLWRYTRHPNYFGELAQWWGLFLIAAQVPTALYAVFGVAIYSWLVVRVTGKATLEKKMSREKPGYAEYVRTTSGLIPWFPKK
jgi:steroid 5-alpha reductase family enzyme